MDIVVGILIYTIPSSIPIWLILQKLKISYWWDYGISFYGMITWFVLLAYFDIGAQSLTNVALECGGILFFSILITTFRYFLYKWTNIRFNKTISVVCILLVISFAVLLRLYMPTLSE